MINAWGYEGSITETSSAASTIICPSIDAAIPMICEYVRCRLSELDAVSKDMNFLMQEAMARAQADRDAQYTSLLSQYDCWLRSAVSAVASFAKQRGEERLFKVLPCLKRDLMNELKDTQKSQVEVIEHVSRYIAAVTDDAIDPKVLLSHLLKEGTKNMI